MLDYVSNRIICNGYQPLKKCYHIILELMGYS